MSTYPLTPRPRAANTPALANPTKWPARDRPLFPEQPLWPTPESTEGPRRFLIIMALVGMLALYACVLATYNAGAHAGVDQDGYLMTARLLANKKNIFAPQHPAPIQVPSPWDLLRTQLTFLPEKPFQSIALPTASKPIPPEPASLPSPLQLTPRFDWLRNRLSFIPESPFQFVGRMNVMTEPFGPADPATPTQYRIYAKYPFGYPLLAAIGLALDGFDALYWVNPLCTILACYFAYFLFRQVVSPFMSLLGVAWLACNPLVLIYANDSNSHASTLFCVCVGFWGLLSWMRTRQIARAWIGGFALGYACTIRYSEFLLVLPVAFAALLHLRLNRPRIRPLALLWFALIAIALEAWAAQWISFTMYERMQTHWLAVEITAAAILLAAIIATIILLRPTPRSLIGSLSLLCAWAIPIATLAAVCSVCFGQPWKTGYTYDHESTGFAWKYLTGDLGHGMVRQGNWETLITQLNHTGLFVLWPLALAGLFALLGSAWRLGTLIALWILPSTCLYMLYYWAPTGEITVGYMRFFMSVMPGLILAGLWILDRGLVILKGERRASLLAITAFGFALLIAAALYVEGDALQLGPAIFAQIATALWHLASETRIGFYGVLLVLTLLAGIWLYDIDLAAQKTGIALGAGILTAVGCAMNLYNITPQVERNFNMSIGLRLTIDNLLQRVPKGSVIFAGDYSLNQIDALNDWKLFNANLFTPAAFNGSKLRVARGNKDNGEDPDPIQLERSQFYMQLLGTQDPRSHAWTIKKPEALRAMEFEIIAKNIAEGRRVFFLNQDNDPNATPFGNGTINMPGRAGYTYKPHPFRWVAPSPNALPEIPNPLRPKPRPKLAPPPAPPSPPRGDVYQLYEIIKSPPPKTPSTPR